MYKKDSVQNYRYKMYTRLQQENKTRYEYTRRCANRTNKSAANSANNTWATRESGSQQSHENIDVKKNCTLGKYIKLNNQDKKAPEKAYTWRTLRANSSSSKDSTRKGLKKKNVFKKVAERTWTNIH